MEVHAFARQTEVGLCFGGQLSLQSEFLNSQGCYPEKYRIFGKTKTNNKPNKQINQGV